MPKNEFNPQDLMMEYELTRQEITAIDQQLRQLQEHHTMLLSAKESINSIKKQGNKEILVPGGGGVYFNTILNNDKTCLINVGAKIIIEMKLDKAEKTISERVDQALSMILKLNEEADMMMKRLQQIELMVQTSQ